MGRTKRKGEGVESLSAPFCGSTSPVYVPSVGTKKEREDKEQRSKTTESES